MMKILFLLILLALERNISKVMQLNIFPMLGAMYAVDESDIVLMLIDASDGIVDQDLRI